MKHTHIDFALMVTTLVLFIVLFIFNGWCSIELREIDLHIIEMQTDLDAMKQPDEYIPRETVPVEPQYVEPKRVSLGTFTVTAYNASIKCCGKTDGITASGTHATEGITIAADWGVLPKGTVVYIEGIGQRTVEDKGGAIKGNKLDLYFVSYSDAVNFGRQEREVWVVNE